jgi:hypothetical protein
MKCNSLLIINISINFICIKNNIASYSKNLSQIKSMLI